MKTTQANTMADVLPFRASTPLAVPDASARAAALDTRASWIVEAPAGSGKTGLLMQRYLKLLAEDSVTQPEEVLAITFTRKATAELRHRIFAELEAAASDHPLKDPTSEFERATRSFAEAALARDRALGWSLLTNTQRLRVRTIDSVCVEIAASLPLLSGSEGARRPVEDANPLYRLAAHRTMLQLGGSDAGLHQALRTVLLHRDGSLADCERLLAKMLAQREQWAELVPLDRASLDDATLGREVRPRLERSLETIVCAGLSCALRALPPGVLHELTAFAQRLSIEPGYNDADSPIACCSDKNMSPEARAEHLDHWKSLIGLLLTNKGTWRNSFSVNHLGFRLPKSDKPELERLIAAISTEASRKALCDVRCLPPTRYPDEQWHVAKALFHLLLRALAELKLIFAEHGECDFAELALAARHALGAEDGAADLAAASGANLRHLLVDEMQDTSSSQYELIQLLTRSWDGHSQTLFLVGDPKQSIYLFRQARVERFLRTMHQKRLGDLPVSPLQLTANFRSQSVLIENFNKNFSSIFPLTSDDSPTESVDIPFVAATAVRQTDALKGIEWHTAILGGDESADASSDDEDLEKPEARETRQHALAEAAAIRDIVEQWQRRPLPSGREGPWRIAVLARARNHFLSIVAEFKRADAGRQPIGFRAVNVEALDERPEVLDVLALTRALLHPADRVAWLAVLHAPWCGLGLADLLTITDEPASSTATIPELLQTNAAKVSPGGRQLLERAWPTLQSILAQTGRGDLAIAVERTWRTLGGDMMLSAEQMANTERFFELLRELVQPGGWVDLGELKRRLNRLYAQPATGEGLVDLMTIHAAKGLEWDVVLVPALEKKGQVSDSQLLNWLELDNIAESEASILLAPIAGKGEDSDDLYKWLDRVRSDRETAERKRLYYVACTRAREELHLFGAVRRNRQGDLVVPKKTLLESCWPAAEEHFTAASPALLDQLQRSVLHHEIYDEAEDDEGLALAASGKDSTNERKPKPPLLHRLPLDVDPRARFAEAFAKRLPYTSASALRQAPAFERPEGGFTVRAFGNVVHRFMQWLAMRLADGSTAQTLLIELPTWTPRVEASLRAEGVSPALTGREASRVLEALSKSLSDATGRWLLSPQSAAASEQTLTFADATTLRVDRTFLAGETPGSSGDACIWIVDFKTTQQGSRSDALFEQEERAKYTEQLEGYAVVRRSLPDGAKPIYLALYYPLVPRLIYWKSDSPK